MSHEPECPALECDDALCPSHRHRRHACACVTARRAYQRGREDVLKPVRELADKFEQEGIHDSDAALRYRLAAARIYGAIGAAARGGEQA